MSAPVLVTGATGFLGSVIVRKLVERGRDVHVLARDTSDRAVLASGLAGLDVTWHVGDLVDSGAVDKAVAEVSRELPADVIHAGALVSYARRDRDLQRAVNVEGTRHVLEASRRYSVRRLVHVSSIVTVAHSSASETLDETAPFNAGDVGVAYVTTKRAAEELALEAASELDVVVVNPGAIFGATTRESSNSNRLLREVRGGKSFPLAPPGGTSCIGVEDTAEGTLLALERGTRGARYILTESYWTHFEMLRWIAHAAGVRAVRWTVPAVIWPLIVFPTRIVDALFPMQYITPQALTMVALHWNLDSALARRELGFRPIPFRDVLAETLEDMNR